MDSEQVIRIALTVVTPILTAGIGIVALVIGDWRERRTQARPTKTLFRRRQQAGQLSPRTGSKPARRSHPMRSSEQPREHRPGSTKPPNSLRSQSHHPPPRKSGPSPSAGCSWPTRCTAAAHGFFAVSTTSSSAWWFSRSRGVGLRFRQDGHARCAQLLLRRVHLRRPRRHLHVHAHRDGRFASGRCGPRNRSPTDAPQSRMTLRSALLLYRFTGIRAHIARIVFWFWVLLTVLIVVAIAISAVDDPRMLPSNLVVLVAWIGWAIGTTLLGRITQ